MCAGNVISIVFAPKTANSEEDRVKNWFGRELRYMSWSLGGISVCRLSYCFRCCATFNTKMHYTVLLFVIWQLASAVIHKTSYYSSKCVSVL